MKNPANILVTGAILAWAGVAGAATTPSGQNDSACSGVGVMFADFASLANSSIGGYWFASCDSTTDPNRTEDSAVGGSTIFLNGPGKAWRPIVGNKPLALPIGVLHANLEKNNPNSKYTYHPYAGWADLGVRVSLQDAIGADFTGLKAISFDFYAGADLTIAGIVPPTGQTYGWNDKIPGLIFKMDSLEVVPGDEYQIAIPVSKAGGKRVCVVLDSLERPSSRLKVGDFVSKRFVPSSITRMRWETRIANGGDTGSHKADMAFGITNVRLHGLDSLAVANAIEATGFFCDYPGNIIPPYHPIGIDGHRSSLQRLRVAYDQGLTLSYAFQGAEPVQVEVLRVDGARVASFSRQASVANHLRLPIALTRGTYLVSVRSGKSMRSAARLAVVR